MMRVFSIKRFALSVIMGFLFPLTYAIFLSLLFDFIRQPTPQFLVWPFGWPRPLWILLLGRQPSEADLLSGIAFIALCNVLLYGSVCYFAFSIWALRRKPAAGDPPPMPTPF